MNKLLLSIILVFIFIGAQAQCTPDPQYTIAGIYPDSATGLSPGFVGQPYYENITIITPVDTFVDVPVVGSVNVTIDNIDLTSVSGLPNNFSYACDPPNCSFPGGSIECAELYSTVDPTAAEIGVYQIIFETTTYVSGIPVIGSTTQDDVIDYYYLEISNTTSAFNMIDDYLFELKEVYPNPVFGQARIQFVSGRSEEVVLNIYNLLGKKVESRSMKASRGVNTISVNTSLFSEGIYLYSINNGRDIQMKRMVVKN